jgi:hypothetical protein
MSDLLIPRRKPWHRVVILWFMVDWCVWWLEVGCMCELGWTWREIETESPNRELQLQFMMEFRFGLEVPAWPVELDFSIWTFGFD